MDCNRAGGFKNGFFERQVPHLCNYKNHIFLASFYSWVKNFCNDKYVIDMGCGSGYGTWILSQGAKRAFGLDISHEAARFAMEYFMSFNTFYSVMDFLNLGITNNSADIIVAREVLEHVYEQEKLIRQVSFLLKQNGMFFISTPNREMSDLKNPHHVRELDAKDLTKLLNKYFPKVFVYSQIIRDEYLQRLGDVRVYQRYLQEYMDRIPNEVIHSLVPYFLRRLFPKIVRAKFYDKMKHNIADSLKNQNKQFDNLNKSKSGSLSFMPPLTMHDVLITSSKEDINRSNYLIAVCCK